jgi:hypothetical protein
MAQTSCCLPDLAVNRKFPKQEAVQCFQSLNAYVSIEIDGPKVGEEDITSITKPTLKSLTSQIPTFAFGKDRKSRVFPLRPSVVLYLSVHYCTYYRILLSSSLHSISGAS